MWRVCVRLKYPGMSPYLVNVPDRRGFLSKSEDVGILHSEMTEHRSTERSQDSKRKRMATEKEQKRRKTDRCQEGAGPEVTRKMGLIPPPIPAAFLLFEVTSGLNFPFWAEQKGSLLGGWKRGLRAAPASQAKQYKYCRSVIHRTRHRTDLYADPESALIRQPRRWLQAWYRRRISPSETRVSKIFKTSIGGCDLGEPDNRKLKIKHHHITWDLRLSFVETQDTLILLTAKKCLQLLRSNLWWRGAMRVKPQGCVMSKVVKIGKKIYVYHTQCVHFFCFCRPKFSNFTSEISPLKLLH